MLFPHFSAPSPILKSDPIILSHCIFFFSYLVVILICNYILICVIIFKCLKQKFILQWAKEERDEETPVPEGKWCQEPEKYTKEVTPISEELCFGGSDHMGSSTFLPWLAESPHSWPSHPTPKWLVINFFCSHCSIFCLSPTPREQIGRTTLAGWEGTDYGGVLEGCYKPLKS